MKKESIRNKSKKKYPLGCAWCELCRHRSEEIRKRTGADGGLYYATIRYHHPINRNLDIDSEAVELLCSYHYYRLIGKRWHNK